jgi:hypothetical protein
MRKNTYVVILSLVISLMVTVGLAQAAPYTVGSGWASFNFGGVGSSWDRTFDFTLTAPAILKVTDGGLDGDRFNVTDNGVSIGNTSIPVNDGSQIFDNYDGAFADSRWSSQWWVLFPGSHSISGTAILSPQGSGSYTGVRVDYATNCVGSVCFQDNFGWHMSQCVVYVPGLMSSINVGQVTYAGCTPGSCPKSFCLFVSSMFP